MDNENHKKTWNNFTKFVLWANRSSVSFGFSSIILTIEIFHEN